MIAFSVGPETSSARGVLVYRRHEYSFDTEGASHGRGVSVVLNDVQLFLNDKGRVTNVSGLCPYHGWKQTSSSPPSYSRGGLLVTGLEDAPNGVAFRVVEPYGWPVFCNRGGWICLGDPEVQGGQAVEFVPSAVAVLQGDQLVALWLCPIFEG